MAPQSELRIAANSFDRLVKEEATYHTELQQERSRLDKATNNAAADDENHEYMLKQQRQAIKQTEAMLPTLQGKIQGARDKVQRLLDSEQDHTPEDIEMAKSVLGSTPAEQTVFHISTNE